MVSTDYPKYRINHEKRGAPIDAPLLSFLWSQVLFPDIFGSNSISNFFCHVAIIHFIFIFTTTNGSHKIARAGTEIALIKEYFIYVIYIITVMPTDGRFYI